MKRDPYAGQPVMQGRMFTGGRGVSLRNVRWWDIDWHVLVIAIALLTFGTLFLRAMAQSDLELGHGEIRLEGHIKKMIVAAPALVLGLIVRPSWLRNRAWLIYAASIVLLILVPIIGDERNNARRWIALPGGFDLQPSELAKLGLILVLARALYRNRVARVSEWGLPVLLAVIPMALVAMQPDLGTALTIVPITVGMMYLAGARATVILRFVVLAVVLTLGVLHFEIGVRDYQLQRIETWMASFEPQPLIEGKNGPAFHTYHARVAIGNGGYFGRGLGGGVANETGYLPERESDSIIAVIAEEGGFVGALALLGLYTLLILGLMLSASGIRDRFSRLVVGGIALYFASHFFVNVSVNVGLLPMTGLTLPLLSTGGSSMLATFAALGLALGLSSNREPAFDGDAYRSY